MKKLVLSLLAFSALQVNAQVPIYQSSFSQSAEVDSECRIIKIKADNTGNQYIAGKYYGTVDLDPGATTLNVTSQAAFTYQYFLQKLSPSGAVIWTIPGVNYEIKDIALTSSGEVRAIAFFNSTAGTVVDIDPTAAVMNVTSIGQADVLLFKVNATGAIQNASLHGLAGENEYPISLDIASNDDIVFCALAYNTSNFTYAMILKRSSTDTPIWQKNLSGPGKCFPKDLTLDNNGSIYVTGRFLGQIDFDPGAGDQSAQNSGAGNQDMFVVKLTSAGVYGWKNTVNGASNNLQPQSIAVDGQGNVYTVGWQRSVTVAYGGPGVSELVVPSGYTKTFIHQLTSTGTHSWARFQNDTIIGIQSEEITIEKSASGKTVVLSEGTTPTEFNSSAIVTGLEADGTNIFEMYEPSGGNTLCMHLDASGNLYLGGIMGNELVFNNGSNSIISDYGSFVLKYSQCIINNAVTLSGTTISSSQAASTYQWIDCGNNNAVINGATAQTFTPTVTGNYAVVLGSGSCTDTSACTAVTIGGGNVGIDENSTSLLSIYPNPTNGIVTVSSSQIGGMIQVMDATGRLVNSKIISTENTTIDLSENNSGVYFVSIKGTDGTSNTKKLIVRK